jgi:hypothetical protein
VLLLLSPAPAHRRCLVLLLQRLVDVWLTPHLLLCLELPALPLLLLPLLLSL